MSRFLGNLTALLFLIFFLLASAGVFTSLINTLLPAQSDSFTSAHFKSPSLPNIFNSSKGVKKNFGKTASSLTLFLMILFPLLTVLLSKLIHNLDDREKESEEVLSITPDAEAKSGSRYFLPALASLFLLAIFMKTLYLNPIYKNNSLATKIISGEKFYVLLNSALAYKVFFMEKDYTDLVFSALERDINEYFAFSKIEYWAVFGRGGATRKVNRKIVASKRLFVLYREGQLTDASIFIAYQASKRAGNIKNAKEMIEYLLKKNPHNKKYNNEYLYILGRWS